MLFNSIDFLIFLSSVLLGYFFIPAKYKTIFLLIVSFCFYGFHHPEYLLVIFISIITNFFIGIRIYKSSIKTKKKTWLYLGVVINILFLGFFKDYFFLSNNFNELFTALNISASSIILPLGISFFTIQNIAYLFDIYRGTIVAEKNIQNFALFVSFFPKVIAGPIESGSKFLPQINTYKNINYENLNSGIQRIAVGFFKKLVLADRLASCVSAVYDSSNNHSGITTILATYLFTFQLYFDFSGYTDIALGISKILGFELTENFKQPLKAKSISEFWRRWHISLSQFFFNYIYYPCVYFFRKWKKIAIVISIVATFLISAMWHGIGFTFLIWGSIHSIYLIFELFTKKLRMNISKKTPSVIYNTASVIITFNLICFAKIFFRSGTMENAFRILKNIFSCSNFLPDSIYSETIAPLASGGDLEHLFNFIITLLLLVVFLFTENKISNAVFSKKNNFALTLILLICILLFGVFQATDKFIYVRF